MEIRVLPINKAKEELNRIKDINFKVIIISSYESDIDSVTSDNKIVLHFDDITYQSNHSFNSDLAFKIKEFVEDIDFEKDMLYICCDSGVSRSSAIAAAILRKYNEDEKVIWKDYTYSPNIFVYQILCNEFGLKTNALRIKHLKNINRKALKKQINKSKNIFSILRKIKYLTQDSIERKEV